MTDVSRTVVLSTDTLRPDVSGRARRLWVLGVLLTGLASQWCINYGVCAAPF